MPQFTPFLRTLKVGSKSQGIIPFVPNSSQRRAVQAIETQYSDLGYVRAIILKSRQIGMSTLAEALLFMFEMIFPPIGGLVMAQDNRTSRELLDKTKLFWNTWILRSRFGKPRYATQTFLHWDNGSKLNTYSAKEVHSIRGITAQLLHLSEIAFWPDPEALMSGLLQGVPRGPRTMVLIESTANGVGGYFYDLWQQAVAGDSEYVPIFVPWYLHEEYEAPSTAKLGALDGEEKILVKLMEKEGFSRALINDKLRWRQWKIYDDMHGDEDKFHQEYPSSAEEAFVSAGVNVFPLRSLQTCYVTAPFSRGDLIRTTSGSVEFSFNAEGPWKIYKAPSDSDTWGVYMVSGDPTFTTTNDPAVIQVINRRTREQVAVFERRMDPISFAEELAMAGTYYNKACVTCEIEGPGYGTIGRLSMIYTNIWQHHFADRWADKQRGQQLGWSTNYQRKELAIGWVKKWINDGSLTLHDQRTFQQLRDYVNTNGEMGPADPNGHDDHVMALAINIACQMFEGPLEPMLSHGPRRGPNSWDGSDSNEWPNDGPLYGSLG